MIRHLVVCSLLLAPSVCAAEVSDKIPAPAQLSLMLCVHVVIALAALGAPYRPWTQLVALVGLSGHAWLWLTELRFSDIGDAVAAEMGRTYVVTTWALLLAPLAILGAGRVRPLRAP